MKKQVLLEVKLGSRFSALPSPPSPPFSLPAIEWIVPSRPKFIYYSPNPYCSPKVEMGFWEILKVKQGHKSRVLIQQDRWPYKRRRGSLALDLSPCAPRGDYVPPIRQHPSMGWEESSQENLTVVATWSWTASLQNSENKKVCCLSPQLWYFVRAARPNTLPLPWLKGHGSVVLSSPCAATLPTPSPIPASAAPTVLIFPAPSSPPNYLKPLCSDLCSLGALFSCVPGW